MYAASDPILQCPPRPLLMDRRWKSNVELAPNCPRCASQNTKFCYYNNYSLSQPRYFCKACRRYWTKGGSLRNVPVGGGCRKSRRAKVSRSPENYRPITITCPSSSPNQAPPVCDPSLSGSGGSDIDLAEVFAKFLNHNSITGNPDPVELETGIGSDLLPDIPGSPNQETLLEADPLIAGLTQQGEPIHEFPVHDPNYFGLQTMVSDGLDHNLLWSDATNLPNVDWQSTVEIQEFGSFSSVDQTKISGNVIGDNWGVFDLSAYEIF